MELFETSFADIVNWQFFTVFMIAVFVNILYGMFYCSIKFCQKLPFKIIGWVLAIFMLYILLITSVKAHGYILDYNSYENIYLHRDSYKDKMFGDFQVWFRTNGFSFDSFRLIFYAITFVNIWLASTIFRANKNIVFGFFALFLWMYFGYQMRMAMAMSFIFVGASLLSLKGWKKVIGFVCFFPLLYLAYSFHGSTVLFGVLILMGFGFKNRNYIAYIAGIVATIFLVSYLFGNNLFIKTLELFPKEILDELSDYATQRPNYRESNQLISVSLTYLAAVVLARLSVSEKRAEKDPDTKKEFHKLTSLFDAGIGMFCIILTVTVSMHCVRYIRHFTFFIFVIIAIAMKNAKFKALNPYVLASIACFLLGTYLNLLFLESWEAGGIDSGFYGYFVF